MRILRRLQHRSVIGNSIVHRLALLTGMAVVAPLLATTHIPSIDIAITSIVSDTSDSLRTGVLPNGMHYYIQRNRSPVHRAKLWLAVNAGSVQEDDDQRGLAHFVEHMAFNGTRRFPGNSLIDLIERAGLNFGADLNAFTSFDETVYQLSIPTDDTSAFRSGLDILEDWANGGISMDSAAVVGERGVVLGEWRQRLPDTMSLRLQQERMARTVGKESGYVNRFPIGLPERIRTVTPEPLARFYRDWYRPDLMAVIAVGDFDPQQMEKTIKERFGRIPAASHPRAFTRPPVVRQNKTVVHIVRDQLPPDVYVTWPAPVQGSDISAQVTQELVDEVLFPYLQHVLTKRAQRERRSFAAVSIGITEGSPRPLGRQMSLAVRMSPDSIRTALADALSEIERVAQHGLPAQELESRKAAVLRQWEQAADAETATPSQQLAERYVGHYLTGEGLLLSPVQRLAMARKLLVGITSERIATAASLWRTDVGRVITVQVPKFASVRLPTQDEMLSVLDSVRNTKYAEWNNTDIENGLDASPKTSASVSTQQDSRLALPGGQSASSTNAAIVSETKDASTGITTWMLSNSARVVYKPSVSNPDQILIYASSPGGYALLPDSLLYSSGRLVADLITASGSLGATTHEQFVQTLQTTGIQRLKVALNAFNEEMTVGGSPKDVDLLFEVMHRQFTEPTVDTIALAEWRRTGMGTLTWSPNDRFAYASSQDRRLAPPSAVNVPFMNLTEAMAVFRDRFGDASDFTFYIVGAVSAERLKPLMARYIATLPSTNRTVHEQPRQVKIKPIDRKSLLRDSTPRLQAEQAVGTIAFMGAFPDSASTFVAERSRINALSWILSRRLRIRLREEMSVTYGASAPVSLYHTPKWFYQIGIQFMTSPDDMPASERAAWEEINALRTTGPTAEELALVTEVQRRQRENAQQSNGWWITQMQICDQVGIPFSTLSSASMAPLLASDIVAAAKRYLPEDMYMQRTMYPTQKTIDDAKKGAAKPDTAARVGTS